MYQISYNFGKNDGKADEKLIVLSWQVVACANKNSYFPSCIPQTTNFAHPPHPSLSKLLY